MCFKKKYKYDLVLLVIWKVYCDIVEFFIGWDWNGDGKLDYGIVGNWVKGDILMF